MSKIICDVCGTSYPETATQCPICGCVRPGDVVTVAGNTDGADSQPASTYTYVKGGRFSKANVKKRNQSKQSYAAEASGQNVQDDAAEESSNKGLLITVIVLFLAIVAVVIYIALRFLAPPSGTDTPDASDRDTAVTTTADTQATTEETEPEVPCTDIVISKREITFEKSGAALLLNVTTMPKNTTDPVVFSTSDEKIATVTQAGKVTAVGGGEAVITVTCGDVVAQCNVICDFESESTETTAPSSAAAEDFELNREDFTMSRKGDSWKLYSGDIPADQITWTSDNESVVTVKDGVVTAVGKGMTTVHAEYNGQKLSCIVRCADSVGTPEENTNTEETPVSSEFSISSVDVTITVDQTFELTLKNKNGETVSVTWTAADPAVCTVSGNSITGAAKGTTTVSAVHEGVTYSCIVRVS